MSSSAIGWVGVDTQLGVSIAGSRSTSATIVSNAVLPLPTTIAARRVVTGTPSDASAIPVSRRLRKCGDASFPSAPRPPR